MNLFTVDLKNQPGELAHLCEALAEHLVNIEVAAVAAGDHGIITFSASDKVAARAALEAAHIAVEAHPAVKVRFTDRPGEGAAFARKLADAGVNIEALLSLSICNGEVVLAAATDRLDEARRLLGNQVID